MSRYAWSMGLIVASLVADHPNQRSVLRDASPFVVFAAAYAKAYCVVAAYISGDIVSAGDVRVAPRWPTWLLAVTIVGIEVGFLFAYRSGWPVGVAFALATTVAAVALAIIGTSVRGDPISPRLLAGIALPCESPWLVDTVGATAQRRGGDCRPATLKDWRFAAIAARNRRTRT